MDKDSQATIDDSVKMTDDYSDNQLYVSLHIDCLPKFTKSLNEMHMANPERFKDTRLPFCLVDFGCCDAVNSLPVYKHIVDIVRGFNPNLPVCIYLNDLPQNDFTKVIQRFNKGFEDYKEVYGFAVGGSFYSPLFPATSIDLMMTSLTLFWITSVPSTNGKRLHFLKDEEAEPYGAAWKKVIDGDWEQFLKLRQTELRSHGRLHIIMNCYDEELTDDDIGRDKFINIYFKQSLLDTLKKYDMMKYEINVTMPYCQRNKNQYLSIFRTDKTELKSVSFDTWKVPCKASDEYKKDHDKEKLARFAQGYVKGFTYNEFKSKLTAACNNEELACKVLDDHYENLYRIYKENADEFYNKEQFAFIVIEK
jgi:hypothetical protein